MNRFIFYSTGYKATNTVPFKFSNNITPKVTSIDQSSPGENTVYRLPSQPITIQGTGFNAGQPSENMVKFDHIHECRVTSATSTTLQCTMDMSTEPSVDKLLPLSLFVAGKGDSLIEIRSDLNYSVVFQHEVTHVAPLSGSTQGRTKVLLQGYALDRTSLSVSFGAEECDIIDQSYFNLTCFSPAGVDTQSISVSDSTYSVVQTETGFNFTYKSTPVVDSYTGNYISAPGQYVQFNVSNVVDGDVAHYQVHFSDYIVDGDEYSVVADKSSTSNFIFKSNFQMPLGSYTIRLHIKGQGYASFTDGSGNVKDHIQGQIQGSVYSVQPQNGSMHGGTEITIDGFGFRGKRRSYPSRVPGANDLTIEQSTVTIDNKECFVTFANSTRVKCITPAFTATGSKQIKVDGEASYKSSFQSLQEKTPVVTSISPISGIEGGTLVIDGSFPVATGVTVKVGHVVCTPTTVSLTQISCTLGSHPAGNASVTVNIEGIGDSNSDHLFRYQLTGTVSNSPISSGHGGGVEVHITGTGYDNGTIVTICDQLCPIIDGQLTPTSIKCISPPSKV